MKKQLLKSALIAVASVGLLAGSGWADTSNANYFSITDTATSNITSWITLNVAADAISFYTGSNEFGIYTYDSVSDSINTFTILTASNYQGEVYTYFIKDGSDTWVSLGDDDITDSGDEIFGNIFGFYYKYNGVNYYTDESLNNVGDVVLTNILSDAVKITLALQTEAGTKTVTTTTDDVSPVPEPATMFLFGAGIIGLAGAVRKKK